MTNPRPKVGIFGLTGCAGVQLQILNCEDRLLRLAQRLEIVDWVMAKSVNDHTCRLDVAFIEGVVASERDLETLKEVRARAPTLVALGTCAVWGGLPAMHNEIPREVLEREVYHQETSFLDTVEARPATHFVPFEFTLPGCPIEREEFLKLVNALLLGTRPELPTVPVCWECTTRGNLCRVVYFEEVCCGSMTRGGCGARCPSHGVACAGCRGPVEEPNFDANITMFADRGISWVEIAKKMRNFSAPVWMTLGLEKEVQRGRER
ncbi:MAG: NADH:ubiquinone oxidoreductase [Thermoanaerobaculaceae bacterium]|nr:NADH:ubiquinone oxidoreductase [Thermoanaerobaculaceae bacterium]